MDLQEATKKVGQQRPGEDLGPQKRQLEEQRRHIEDQAKKMEEQRKIVDSKVKQVEEKERQFVEIDKQLKKRREQMDQLEASLQKVPKWVFSCFHPSYVFFRLVAMQQQRENLTESLLKHRKNWSKLKTKLSGLQRRWSVFFSSCK